MHLNQGTTSVDGDSGRGSSNDAQDDRADTRARSAADGAAATGIARVDPPPLRQSRASAASSACTAPSSGPARRRACPSAAQPRHWRQRDADAAAATAASTHEGEEGEEAAVGEGATAAATDAWAPSAAGLVRRVASASLGSTASSASPLSRTGRQRGPRAAVLARPSGTAELALRHRSAEDSYTDASASFPAAGPPQQPEGRSNSSTDTVDVPFPSSVCASSLTTTPTAAARGSRPHDESAAPAHADPNDAVLRLSGGGAVAGEVNGPTQGLSTQSGLGRPGSGVRGFAVSPAPPTLPPPPSIITNSCSLARVVQLLAQSGSSSPPHTPRQQLHDAEVWVRQVWEEQRLLQAQLAVAEAKTAALSQELQASRCRSTVGPVTRESVEDAHGNSTQELAAHTPPPAVAQTARGAQPAQERLSAPAPHAGDAADDADAVRDGERGAAYTAELEAYVRRLEQHTHALHSEKQQLQLRLDHRASQLAAAQERYTRLQREQAVLEDDYRRATEDVEEVVSLLVVARAAERAAMRRVEEMELALAASERRADELVAASGFASALDGSPGEGARCDGDGGDVGYTAAGAIQLASWRQPDPRGHGGSGAHEDSIEYDTELVPDSSRFVSFMEMTTEGGTVTPRPMSERPLMGMPSSRTKGGGGGGGGTATRTHSAAASATRRGAPSTTVVTPVHGAWAAAAVPPSPPPPPTLSLPQRLSRPASPAVALAAALDAADGDDGASDARASAASRAVDTDDASSSGTAAAAVGKLPTPPAAAPPAVPPLPIHELMRRRGMPRVATPPTGTPGRTQRTHRGSAADGGGWRSKQHQLELPRPRRETAADAASTPDSPSSASVSVSSLLSPLVSSVTALLTPRSLAQQRRQVQQQFHTLRSARGAEGERVEEGELLRFRCTLLELELQGKEAAHRAEREAWEASVRHAEGVAGAMGEVEARVRQATAASEKVKGLLHEMSRLWTSALTLDDDEDSEDDLLGGLATPQVM